MNKDVIYIEPEDDITDIITKIENAKEKIVALVVPKKADIFRSAVNIKLIAKTSAEAKKSAVLVTTEPSVVKLAAIAKLPVTKDLKTVPSVPELDKEELDIVEIKDEESTETEEVVAEDAEEEAEDVEEEEKDEEDEEDEKDEGDKEEKDDKEESKKDEKKDEKSEDKKDVKAEPKDKAKKAKKDKKGQPGVFGWIKSHKIIVISAPIAIALIALVLFWAFAIAPAVKIAVTIRTTKNNFSENITFTTKIEEEDAKAGKFYLEEKKQVTPVKVEFKATGTKNIGEKAHGEVVAFFYFEKGGSINIPQGSSFSHKGLYYTSDEAASLYWDGKSLDPCGNVSTFEEFVEEKSCLITTAVKITANGSGSSYNIEPSREGWATTGAPVGVYSIAEISGGTDRTITVVQQADIDTAKESLTSPANETENRNALMESIGEDSYKIDSSFRQSVGEVTASPALDEEVKEGVTPTLSAELTSSIFILDLTKVKEYIAETAKVSEKNRIYSIDNPFVESFTSIEGGYAGRLKTVYTVGPNISAESVLESVKGELIGKIKPIMLDAGAREVTIERSFPWVNSVPNDPNKIEIEIITEE